MSGHLLGVLQPSVVFQVNRDLEDTLKLLIAALSLAAKSAHRHLFPGDFDLAQEIAKRIASTRSARLL